MPLARILTLHPEHAGALAHQLESHGYKVEFAHPEPDTANGADLLVNFDLCPQEAALARATELAQELHCDIVIERGFDHEKAPTIAPVAAMVEPEPERVEDPIVPVHASAEESISPATAPHFSYNEEGPVVDSGLRSEPEQMISAQSPESLPSQAQPSQVTPLQVVSVPVGEKRSGRLVTSLAQSTAKALVTSRTFAADAWDSARQFGQEYKQKLDLSRAERSAIRQQRLLELENQKIVAQQRAKELDAARQSAAQRLQELLRDRGEAGDNAQVNPPAPLSPATPFTPSTSAPQIRRYASAGFFRTQMIKLLGHRYSPQTEAIITGVAAVTALFVVGLVVASFHPRAALSSSLDQPTPATIGVTLQTGGVTLKPVATQPPAIVRPAAAPIPVLPKASPIHRAQAGNETSFGSDVTVRNVRPKQTASSREVTVKHIRAQAKPAAVKLQPQDGIKHISDLDN
jgi:hypothetical protein